MLDFSAMDKVQPAAEKPAERATEGANGKLQQQADNNQYVIERAKEVYQRWQDAYKAAGTLRNDLLLSIRDNTKSERELLKDACRIIALLTDNELYAETAAKILDARTAEGK